jgi:hypothetical protein
VFIFLFYYIEKANGNQVVVYNFMKGDYDKLHDNMKGDDEEHFVRGLILPPALRNQNRGPRSFYLSEWEEAAFLKLVLGIPIHLEHSTIVIGIVHNVIKAKNGDIFIDGFITDKDVCKQIKIGYYRGLSIFYAALGHNNDMDRRYTEGVPIEVSVCRLGAVPRSRILFLSNSHYFYNFLSGYLEIFQMTEVVKDENAEARQKASDRVYAMLREYKIDIDDLPLRLKEVNALVAKNNEKAATALTAILKTCPKEEHESVSMSLDSGDVKPLLLVMASATIARESNFNAKEEGYKKKIAELESKALNPAPVITPDEMTVDKDPILHNRKALFGSRNTYIGEAVKRVKEGESVAATTIDADFPFSDKELADFKAKLG